MNPWQSWRNALSNLLAQPSRRRPRSAATRHHRLRLEGLEGRYAPAGFAFGLGGDQEEIVFSVATDAEGNVYAAGNFASTVDFDPGDGSFELTSNGSQDIFVAKYTSAGDLLWAVNAGNEGNDTAFDIAIGGDGNVVVTGQIAGVVDFDPGPGTAIEGGGLAMFVWKLTADGEFGAVLAVPNNSEGRAVVLDPAGNIYVTGFFTGALTVATTGGPVTLPGAGQTDIVVLKLDGDLNVLYARQLGGPNNDRGIEIAVDAAGNVFTTGSFAGTADFNPGSGTSKLTAAGADIFVSKLNSAGNFVWARRFGGTNAVLSDRGEGLAVDAQGNVYVGGVFFGTADFNPGSGVLNLTSGTAGDGFLLKLNSAGQFQFAQNFGGQGLRNVLGMAEDAESVYLTGSFSGADFDPAPGSQFLLTATLQDAYVAKYSKRNGAFQWAVQASGDANDFGHAIAVDDSGNVYSGGHFFSDLVDFDPGQGVFEVFNHADPEAANSSSDAFLWQIPQRLEVTLPESTDGTAGHFRLDFADLIELRDVDSGPDFETQTVLGQSLGLTTSTITILGSTGPETMQITFSTGDNPRHIPLEINVNLGGHEQDRLRLDPDFNGSMTYRPTSAGASVAEFNRAGFRRTVSFEDVGILESNSGNTVRVEMQSGADELTLSATETDFGVAATLVTGTHNGIEVTPFVFANFDRFQLNSFAAQDRFPDLITIEPDVAISLGNTDVNINTGVGNDRVVIGPGNFRPPQPSNRLTISLGAGTDTLEVFEDANITVSGSQTTILLAATGGATGQMVASNADTLVLHGGPSDNVLDARLITKSVQLFGEEGNDTLLAGNGGGEVHGGDGQDFIRGGSGVDQLFGEEGDDDLDAFGGHNTLDGGTGDDRLKANGGNDSMVGGDGDDVILAGGGNNTVDAGDGDDQITTGTGRDTVAAGEGDNTVTTGDGGDSITAGAGNDEISSGTGDDTVNAGDGQNIIETHTGNDAVTSGGGDDLISTGTGNDTIDAGDGDDTIDAGTGNDIIFAGGGLDFVLGGSGNDTIEGGDGDDRLEGGSGNDRLIGGAGNDVLASGDGNDYLKGDEGDDELNGGTGTDTMDGCLDLDTFELIEIFLNCDVEDPLQPL